MSNQNIRRSKRKNSYPSDSSSRKAYNRNSILLIISGMGIIISMIAGTMCVPENDNNSLAETSLQISAKLVEKFPNFLFDSKIIKNEEEAIVEVSVIRSPSQSEPPGLIAEIEKITYSVSKLEKGSLVINFFVRMKMQRDDEILAFEKKHEASFSEIADSFRK